MLLSCVSGLLWPLALPVTDISWEKLAARKEVVLLLVAWQLQVVSQQLWQSGWHHQAPLRHGISKAKTAQVHRVVFYLQRRMKMTPLTEPSNPSQETWNTQPSLSRLLLKGDAGLKINTSFMPWTTMTWRQVHRCIMYLIHKSDISHAGGGGRRAAFWQRQRKMQPFTLPETQILLCCSLESCIKSCWGWSCSLKNSKANQLTYILFENTEVCK